MLVLQSHEPSRGRVSIWALRLVILMNFVRFGLSFLPWFEGTSQDSGLADRIFRTQWYGFRADFVWLTISTMFIVVALFYFLPKRREGDGVQMNVYLCIAWVLAFVVYLGKVLATGILDFG